MRTKLVFPEFLLSSLYRFKRFSWRTYVVFSILLEYLTFYLARKCLTKQIQRKFSQSKNIISQKCYSPQMDANGCYFDIVKYEGNREDFYEITNQNLQSEWKHLVRSTSDISHSIPLLSFLRYNRRFLGARRGTPRSDVDSGPGEVQWGSMYTSPEFIDNIEKWEGRRKIEWST